MKERQQSSTNHPIGILLISSSDHVSGVPSPDITLFKIAKDGGAWSDPVGALAPTAYGWHSWAPAAADRNTLGELRIHVEADGCDPCDEQYEIVARDPYGHPALTTAERNGIADAVLTRDWTQIVSWPTRCALQALRLLRNRWWVDASKVLHVTTENDSTEAWTSQLTTDADAEPIVGATPS